MQAKSNFFDVQQCRTDSGNTAENDVENEDRGCRPGGIPTEITQPLSIDRDVGGKDEEDHRHKDVDENDVENDRPRLSLPKPVAMAFSRSPGQGQPLVSSAICGGPASTVGELTFSERGDQSVHDTTAFSRMKPASVSSSADAKPHLSTTSMIDASDIEAEMLDLQKRVNLAKEAMRQTIAESDSFKSAMTKTPTPGGEDVQLLRSTSRGFEPESVSASDLRNRFKLNYGATNELHPASARSRRSSFTKSRLDMFTTSTQEEDPDARLSQSQLQVDGEQVGEDSFTRTPALSVKSDYVVGGRGGTERTAVARSLLDRFESSSLASSSENCSFGGRGGTSPTGRGRKLGLGTGAAGSGAGAAGGEFRFADKLVEIQKRRRSTKR
eukprot:g3171.t1